ncbi:hypothetical protein BC629DRAFT_1131188 [Irpex lacteus]|nr:hypothetical protein BC629DRAFT_1131188 [Irpex lacteus]
MLEVVAFFLLAVSLLDYAVLIPLISLSAVANRTGRANQKADAIAARRQVNGLQTAEMRLDIPVAYELYGRPVRRDYEVADDGVRSSVHVEPKHSTAGFLNGGEGVGREMDDASATLCSGSGGTQTANGAFMLCRMTARTRSEGGASGETGSVGGGDVATATER